MRKGLTVRWSLAAAGDGVDASLAAYVADTSHARFTGMAGLQFATWRTVPGEWFEASYVFISDEARSEFQTSFAPGAAESRVSQIVGSSPTLIEPCAVVAIAEGWDGFTAAPRA